jgi:hypothetical protein
MTRLLRARESWSGAIYSQAVADAMVCDLPRDFHPALIGAAAVVVMPFGALFAMGPGMPGPIAKIVSA